MRKSYTIQLDSLDLGQLLDGLELRAESWERTADYLRGGTIEGDFIVAVGRCCCAALISGRSSSFALPSEEADDIGAYYRNIISTIRQQMEAQS